MSYLVSTIPYTKTDGTAVPAAATRPSTDTNGTLVDNGDGTYVYTFARDITKAATIVTDAAAGDLTYAPTYTHRLVVAIGTGSVRGTGSNNTDGTNVATGNDSVIFKNPANIIYDFIPSTGAEVADTDTQREIVTTAACNTCHQKIGTTTPHTARIDTRFCVTCHNDQRKVGRTNVASVAKVFATAGSGYVLDNETQGDFPVMIHKIHAGSKLVKSGAGYNYVGIIYHDSGYPQEVKNCAKCHDEGKSLQGANWNTKPSRLACGACHDGLNFTDGSMKSLNSTNTSTEHDGGAQADDSSCASCHTPEAIKESHAIIDPTKNAALRTLKATITGAAVSSTDGSVTVNFTLLDGTTPVGDLVSGIAASPATYSQPAFTLVKLVAGTDGASNNWVSYTARCVTTNAAKAPVIQSRYEPYKTGQGGAVTLVDAAKGTYTYKFALKNGATPGDIRTLSPSGIAYNVSAATGASAITGAFSVATMPTCAYPVTFEPTLTHRVGMSITRNVPAAGDVPAKSIATNATYDFVPDGTAVKLTRNIVTMANCKDCHNSVKMHAGYETEYCVTCHNSSSHDPTTGGASYSSTGGTNVDLQRIAHKIHMGKNLPSVIAGGTFTIAGTSHDYSKVSYPGVINNCAKCHVEGTGAPSNAANWYTKPTIAACGACHDGADSTAHMTGMTEATCTACHGSGRELNVKAVHRR